MRTHGPLLPGWLCWQPLLLLLLLSRLPLLARGLLLLRRLLPLRQGLLTRGLLLLTWGLLPLRRRLVLMWRASLHLSRAGPRGPRRLARPLGRVGNPLPAVDRVEVGAPQSLAAIFLQKYVYHGGMTRGPLGVGAGPALGIALQRGRRSRAAGGTDLLYARARIPRPGFQP